MDGAWVRGGVSGDHSGVIFLLLREDDGRVTGTACRISSLHLIFRDLPVTGKYPRVTFDYFGSRFTGGIVSEGIINGFYEYPGGSQQWYFQRTSQAAYDECHNARP